MGVTEVDANDKQWGSQAPKKKWKHWYMSFGDDERTNGSESKSSPERRESDPPPLPLHFKTSSHKSTMASFDAVGRAQLQSPSDRRPSLGSPVKDPEEQGSIAYRRGPATTLTFSPSAGAASATPTAVIPTLGGPLRSAPIQVPQATTYFTPSHDTFSSSPSISPSNSSSGGDSISPLGLVSAFRSNSQQPLGSNPEPSPLSRRCGMEASPISHLSSMEANSHNAQYQVNGFIRPLNGLGGKGGVLTSSALDHDDDNSHDTKEELGKKRAGSTPSREVHNKLEKNRRAHLKECFETLRRQLPSMEDKKISNQTILKAAHRYIQTLKRREKEFEHEMERLAREKIAHQQQLSSLKKELQTKWDHLDFSTLLPDMNSLEQQRERDTKSTTTASEQPDLEEDSRDSLRFSNNLTQTESSGTYVHVNNLPVDLTPTPQVTISDKSFQNDRDSYLDPNQPLNLSTNTPIRSPRRASPNPPSSAQLLVNGEWTSRTPPYAVAYPNDKTPLPKGSSSVNKPIPTPAMISAVGKAPNPPNIGVNVTRMAPFSTNAHAITPHISADSALSTSTVATVNTTVANLSHLVKAGTTVSHIPSITKVVTTLPHVSTLTPVGATISNIPSSLASNIGQIHLSSSEPNHQAAAIPVRASVAHITNVANGTALPRVTSGAPSNLNNTVTVATSAEHQIPLVGSSGIQLPAHLVTNGVHLTGATGGIIGQPAIQVITPEAYKLIPAEHAPNGVKPVAFALAQPGGLEHLSNVEDGKHTPVMVAVNKNGLSALHLTVPATARAIGNSNPGNSVPVSSVPLNLSVPGSTQAVKVSQAGSAPLISSYIPLTHANGLTRLVQGMSVVGPLVVSQSQRGGVVVPAHITTGTNKAIKTQGVASSSGGGGTTTLPLAQYATTLTGGLVNSVVVVSASAAPSVSSSMAISTAKN